MAELATFIADNLTTNDNTKLTPASQAFALKALLDAQATTVAGKASTAQLATEQARILALETSQATQDTAIGLRATTAALTAEITNRGTAEALLLPKADVVDSYAGGPAKAASAERAKDLDTRLSSARDGGAAESSDHLR
jgi:hypothetical protein